MKRIVSAIVVAGLAACQAPGPITIPGITRAPQNAEDALDAYYRTLPEEFYPRPPDCRCLRKTLSCRACWLALVMMRKKPDRPIHCSASPPKTRTFS